MIQKSHAQTEKKEWRTNKPYKFTFPYVTFTLQYVRINQQCIFFYFTGINGLA